MVSQTILRHIISRGSSRSGRLLIRGFSTATEALAVNGSALAVRKFEPIVVQPESKTPDGSYFLSSLDQAIPFTMKTIHRYEKGGDNVGDVLKQALSKALVHYYPLAGSMAISPQGNFMVDLTQKAAPFVEAEADCSLDVLGDVRIPNPAVTNKLTYSDPNAKNILETPLLSAQVERTKPKNTSL